MIEDDFNDIYSGQVTQITPDLRNFNRPQHHRQQG